MRVAAAFLVLSGLFISGCRPGNSVAETKPGALAKPTEVQVQVLATIHKFHSSNPEYPYRKVTELISRFNPDIIAVEIRPEDIKEDSAYLAKFYPLEMRQALNDFPLEKIRGFDWYGEEMRGRKLPDNVFKDESTELGQVKKMERDLNQDIMLAPKLIPLVALGKQQAEMAKTFSPARLNNGEYDKVTASFYAVLYSALAKTKYQKFADFNQQRDQEIAKNIEQLVKENPGKRLIFLLGANHHGPVVAALQKQLAEQLKLVPVQD